MWVYPKYCQRYKKLKINELIDFIFEKYYETIGFARENSNY